MFIMKNRLIVLFWAVILLCGCEHNGMYKAVFTNTKPAIINMNGVTYSLTEEELKEDLIQREVGKVDRINEVVSYLEEDNPYKNIEGIYSIKDEKVVEKIALKINNKIYVAVVER